MAKVVGLALGKPLHQKLCDLNLHLCFVFLFLSSFVFFCEDLDGNIDFGDDDLTKTLMIMTWSPGGQTRTG